jgi:hypothetical protein
LLDIDAEQFEERDHAKSARADANTDLDAA